MQKSKFTISTVAQSVPFDNTESGLQADNVQEFINLGLTVKNETPISFTVNNGYTRFYPNLSISDDFTIEIEENAELIVL